MRDDDLLSRMTQQYGDHVMGLFRAVAEIDLGYYEDHPDEELPLELVEAIGLDGTGVNADERFPYAWADLTDDELDHAVKVWEFARS